MSTAIIGVIGAFLGGGLLGFIQFLISRRDQRNDNTHELIVEIQESLEQINDLKDDIKRQNHDLRHLIEKKDALQNRTHILRFNDELLNGVRHSHEFFLNIFDVIKHYDDYCKANPNFRNGRTVRACENIEHVYEVLFDQKFEREHLEDGYLSEKNMKSNISAS